MLTNAYTKLTAISQTIKIVGFGIFPFKLGQFKEVQQKSDPF